ncbi:glycosyltransferase [Pseudomonas sp. NBRC 111133]|uniref:glycosyltransferase n=1 Tax=Pseudomonas sp. NBRC 111133 TaxID=1661048 RepID=UPI0009E7CB82|nr:glycosyltransferase [Pseudomonas sp. NBRC 111133]
MADIAAASSNEVTVIVLGQGQNAYQTRAQYYYQQAGIPSLAFETSSVNVANTSIRDCLASTLSQVTTPFVVLAEESDFVLESALQHAVECLHAQPLMIAAQGYALGMVVGSAEVKYYKLGAHLGVQNGSGALSRLQHYAQAGRQAWRAVVRVSALQAALAEAPPFSDEASFRLGLAYSILALGEIAQLDQTDVLSAYKFDSCSLTVREERLNRALHFLRDWDSKQNAPRNGDSHYVILSEFVRNTYDHGDATLLFTSSWNSVVNDPERSFEVRQWVEMPYYNSGLFSQLSAVEFLCHAWPAGKAQYDALEGVWVRQRDLLQEHPNDTVESLQLRYWQALALGLFDPELCKKLLQTLTEADNQERAEELKGWLSRLERVPSTAYELRLQVTPSGRILRALEAAHPDVMTRQRVSAAINARCSEQFAFIVLDLGNDDIALQTTFDSILAAGVSNFKLVVLKAGRLPAVTTARDTLHFIRVAESNWVNHLNEVVRQLPSDWLLLLEAGDVLLGGGLLRLMVEVQQASTCHAIAANEVQRDVRGGLLSIARPGANLDLLRTQPGLMSRHWLVRRQTVLDLGGYAQIHRHGVEFEMLLRIVEAKGVAGVAHMDEYLVIGQEPSSELSSVAASIVSGHLKRLGYRAQVSDEGSRGLGIDYRHDSTPLVSILVASEGDERQLEACVTAVLQRTRYPRYEIILVGGKGSLSGLDTLQSFSVRVRAVSAKQGASQAEWLNLAAGEARGEYLILLSERCRVQTPAWVEVLLNEAQRPEVGVVGAALYDADGAMAHAGFELVRGGLVQAPWHGASPRVVESARWPLSVRSCKGVAGECLMVRKDVFRQIGGLSTRPNADIELSLAVEQAGHLVVWTPRARLVLSSSSMAPERIDSSLEARWPSAFGYQQQFTVRDGEAVQPNLDWLTEI